MRSNTAKDHEALVQFANSITSPWMKSACLFAIERMKRSWSPGSAGKHHAYMGGLMSHTLEVVRLCDAMASSGSLRVNRNVLITAAILHDIEKKSEYYFSEGYQTIQKTRYRRVIRHVVGGVVWLEGWLNGNGESGINYDEVMDVEHCMLAHHGRLEWGSPVEPQTVEAQILHFADMLSAGHGISK